jgi:RHS repeat-associated protein
MPSVYSFGYDSDDQLISAAVTNSGVSAGSYSYTYDPSGNRLTETVGASTATSSFNPLNQLSTTANPAANQRTCEWDAMHRLTAVNAGNLRTQIGYDGASRVASIQQLQNGAQISSRRFVWIGKQIAEERDGSGSNVTKRFFPQGVLLTTGTNAGSYYYTRDHLGSVRELTDSAGNLRARYSYDPYGRTTKLTGDLDADFGFAGMLWSPEANLSLAHFRAYDAGLGRWLSRDPLQNAEFMQGPNLYAYVGNEPINLTDRSGLSADGLGIQKQFWQWNGNQWLNDGNGWFFRARGAGEIQDVENETLDAEVQLEESDITESELDLEMAGGEIEEVTDEADELYQYMQQALLENPPPSQLTQSLEGTIPDRQFPGLLGVGSEFIGAGITILTMTDCDTANGILGLVRQGKGGMLNIYEDRLRRQLEQEGVW